MEILTILGFILFATFAVFGIIDSVYKLRELGKQHEALLKQVEDQREEEIRQRLQYLAGIQTPLPKALIPDVVEKDILQELMEETAVVVELELQEKKKRISKQYTRR